MLTIEYDSRYAKAQEKFLATAQEDAVKLAFTMETCPCHNLQALWMLALSDYDPTPGAANVITEAQLQSLFCRMGADGITTAQLAAAVPNPPPPVDPPPVPTFTADWAWMADDPYAALLLADDIVYNGSGAFPLGNDIYADLRSAPADYYNVVRYPDTESSKVTWYNDIFNYGTLPDFNFRAVLVAHGYKYVVSSRGLTLNIAELTKFY